MKRSSMKQAVFPQWRKATEMAAQAHEGQTIRTSSVPYIVHPMRVAMAVHGGFGCKDDEVLAAAILHDTVEKTSITLEQITGEFGSRVSDMVDRLSKDKRAGKKSYWDGLLAACWETRLIKMADALDHLDCPLSEIPRRIKSGRKALDLAFSNEKEIRRAREILALAIEEAEARLAVN